MVTDDRAIINPQGIRFVEKIDQQPYMRGSEPVKYRLRVTYKGDVLDYEYQDAAARDAQFARLQAALGPPPSGPAAAVGFAPVGAAAPAGSAPMLAVVLLAIASAVVAPACRPLEQSAAAPVPLPAAVTAPTAIPAVAPPFAVSLWEGRTPANPGVWPLIVRVTATPGVVSPDPPALLRVECADQVRALPAGWGDTVILCAFSRPGAYTARASVSSAGGWETSAALAVNVTAAPTVDVELHYSVTETSSAGDTRVAFGVRAVASAERYSWDFGDGTSLTTLLPQAFHTYCCQRQERRARVRVTDVNGDLLATGIVAGRW